MEGSARPIESKLLSKVYAGGVGSDMVDDEISCTTDSMMQLLYKTGANTPLRYFRLMENALSRSIP
jgi:hypothetical protein